MSTRALYKAVFGVMFTVMWAGVFTPTGLGVTEPVMTYVVFGLFVGVGVVLGAAVAVGDALAEVDGLGDVLACPPYQVFKTPSACFRCGV